MYKIVLVTFLIMVPCAYAEENDDDNMNPEAREFIYKCSHEETSLSKLGLEFCHELKAKFCKEAILADRYPITEEECRDMIIGGQI